MATSDGQAIPEDIRLVELSRSPGSPTPAWVFEGMARVDQASTKRTKGYADDAFWAAEYASDFADQADAVKRWLVALSAVAEEGPESVIGFGRSYIPRSSGATSAFVHAMVHPAHERKGVGTALIARLEAIAKAEGRSTLQSLAPFGGPRPRDGISISESSAYVGLRFALARGYTVRQWTSRQVLELPLAPSVIDAYPRDRRTPPDGYQIHTWANGVPDRWVNAVAALEAAMRAGAPTGGMTRIQDVWDADRVRRSENLLRAAGRSWLVTVAEDAKSGELAALTQLVWHREPVDFVSQTNTVVLPHHRGHRLGMRVKLANLDALRDARPIARRVLTWVAEENRPMHAVNETLGFRAISGAAKVEKRSDDPDSGSGAHL